LNLLLSVYTIIYTFARAKCIFFYLALFFLVRLEKMAGRRGFSAGFRVCGMCVKGFNGVGLEGLDGGGGGQFPGQERKSWKSKKITLSNLLFWFSVGENNHIVRNMAKMKDGRSGGGDGDLSGFHGAHGNQMEHIKRVGRTSVRQRRWWQAPLSD
jgi:hypothetical protein